jgi:alpha-tubulin suppressor-like RCC1 family protein
VARKPAHIALGVIAAVVMVVAGACSSGRPVPQNSVAASVETPPVPAPGTSAVEHWGVFFGDVNGFWDRQETPATVTLPGTVVQIGTSNSDEYALLADGSVYGWGMNTQGQLGNGLNVNSFETPVRVHFPAGVKIAFLATDAMPYDSALAVDTKGHAWAWGDNSGGEFCKGNLKDYFIPVELPFSDVTLLAGADAHALYYSDGTAYSCGDNVNGDLGDGRMAASSTPVKIVRLGKSRVTTLVASFDNSGALLANGDYYDWGYNADGQLGDGQSGNSKWSDVPVHVQLPGPVTVVALGGSIWHNGQTLALVQGTLWGWGADWSAQLAQGKRGRQPVPVQILLPQGVRFTMLATGSGTCYGVTPSGNVYAWGANYAAQVGDDSLILKEEPEEVAVGAVQISSTANNAAIRLRSANTST